MEMQTDRVLQEMISQRRLDEVHQKLDGLLKANPNDAQAHYLKGVSFYKQGKVSATVQSLRKALDLNPKHTDAAVCLSVLYNDLGKYQEAKHAFHQANMSAQVSSVDLERSVDQKFSIKHHELGDLYFRYRRFDEALDQFQRAFVLTHDRGLKLELELKKIRCYLKKGFITRAEQSLETLKREHPTQVAPRLELAEIKLAQGQVLEAELELEVVKTLEPQNARLKAIMGKISSGTTK